jgi:flagellar biosynthesis/type III secretory pathway M-ring protein FliF/YscJ
MEEFISNIGNNWSLLLVLLGLGLIVFLIFFIDRSTKEKKNKKQKKQFSRRKDKTSSKTDEHQKEEHNDSEAGILIVPDENYEVLKKEGLIHPPKKD